MGISQEISAETIERDDFGHYFKGIEKGTFVLYDETNDQHLIYNLTQSEAKLSPCSTFKIYNSLAGLEYRVLNSKDQKTLKKWDGSPQPYDNWKKDHTLSSAIQNSVVWYFQELATQIGETRMQVFLNKINYGNKDISGGLTTFWLQSSLKISAQEQVDLIHKLYAVELPIKAKNIEILKKNITLYNQDGVHMMGKTGSGDQEGKWVLGWFVGVVEKDGNRYFFATNIEGRDGAYGGKAKSITFSILKELGITKE
jgi:bla regulator protein BlaR1